MRESVTICGALPICEEFPLEELCSTNNHWRTLPRIPDTIIHSLEDPAILPPNGHYTFIFRERTANKDYLAQVEEVLPLKRIKRLESTPMPYLLERHFRLREAYTGVLAILYYLCQPYKYIYATGMSLYSDNPQHKARLREHALCLRWLKDTGAPVIYDKILEEGISALIDDPG